jgi:mannosyltransferase OCH1-like enzyme
MENTLPRNGNPLHQYGTRRSIRWLLFILFAGLITLFLSTQSYTPNTVSGELPKSKGKAKYLTPQELMERPISKDLQAVPKLFHQSWSSTKLPAKFEKWSDTCRRAHPDWEWVLWTDEDNEELVKKHFPWLLKTYKGLPGVIYRADLVRNLYMHLYGG